MPERVSRLLLWALAVSAAVIGVWACFFPRSFYASFPGGGRAWVSADGPFNERLVRDVGELNLALFAVTLFAAIRGGRDLTVATGLAWLAYSIPHLAYHLTHLGPYGTSDTLALVVSLSLPVVAGVLLLLPPRAAAPAARPA